MEDPETPPDPRSLGEEYAAAQAWWQAAGVDQDYDDVTTNWLAEPESSGDVTAAASGAAATKAAPKKVAEAPKPVVMGGDQAAWPVDLPAFKDWWLNEATLDSAGTFPRIAPRGEAGAKVMIVVAEPEEQDSETLLSGPLGMFLGNILDAAGISPEETYFAAALPRHTPMPDWQAMRDAGLGAVLHHHIGLAAPERICVLGRNIWALFGHDLTQGSAFLPNVNHEGRSVPVLGAEGIGELLRSTTRRERFWRNWLEWTDG